MAARSDPKPIGVKDLDGTLHISCSAQPISFLYIGMRHRFPAYYHPGRKLFFDGLTLINNVGGCLMTPMTCRWLWLFIFALGFQHTGLAWTESRTLQPGPAQSPDVIALATALI